ncbi:MAG: translation initiation factor IF-3, partial [Phycisphaerales bacterium]|nr:translation initiation factor IF-3 [Phycisphaerales bacterium]
MPGPVLPRSASRVGVGRRSVCFPEGVLPISRFSRPGSGGPPQRTRVNHFIRITPIRVVGPNGEQIGVIETPAALRMAEEQGLDLVEISPDARPPVCKIMDFGKFKYELSKQSKNKGAKAS